MTPLRFLFSIILMLSLSACAELMGESGQPRYEEPTWADEEDMAPTETETPATAETVPAPEPQQRPEINPSEELAGEREPALVVPAPGPATEKPDFSVLIGRDFTGVQALLGPADRIEDASPGRKWEYREGTCLLTVRFYPDLKTLDYRVLSYAVDNEETAHADDEDSCSGRFAAKFGSGS